MILALAASALVGAFVWRVRGGAWETLLRLPPRTTLARLTTALVLSIITLPSAPLWAPLILTPALWLGMALAGWGEAMDIGRVRGNPKAETVEMTLWGLVTTLPGAAVLAWLSLDWWWLVAAGALFGPTYWACWEAERALPRLPRFASGPTEWAEVACGAAIGAALGAA